MSWSGSSPHWARATALRKPCTTKPSVGFRRIDILALAREAPGDQVACENAGFRLGVSAEQRHLRSLRCGSDRFRAFGWHRSDHVRNRLDVRPVGRPAFHQASRALFQQLLVGGRRLRHPFVDRRQQGQAELQAIAPSLNTFSCSSSLNQDQRPGQATYCAIVLTLKHRARQASAPNGLLRLQISFHLSGVEEKAAPTEGSGRGRKPLALVECTWEVDYRLAEGYQPLLRRLRPSKTATRSSTAGPISANMSRTRSPA